MKKAGESYEQLAASYEQIKIHLAWQDLEIFFKKELEKSMELLKQKDDPTARATWQFIDKFYERIGQIKKEGEKEQKEREERQKLLR